MEMRFQKTIQNFKGVLKAFEPFPRARERAAYEALSPSLRETLIKEGESYLDYEYPTIRATDFMNFKRTGDRVRFETIYFAKRHALNGLVAAECAEHKGRFLDDIINGIFAICEESAWQLPPHNTYVRDAPQLLLPDASRPVLDLFACETGACLACVNYLLGEELDAVSPFITKRIHQELNHRIISPYLQEHFWWMGKGEEPMCNWTAWCTQNVLLTAFLDDYDENIRRQVIDQAAASCDYFLKDYGEDGCCDEGAQYYRHAGLCLCNAMEILDTVTDGAFRSLFLWEKIKNIAAYIQNVHVADKYYFNFADCSPVAGRAGVQEYLFGKYTEQPQLMQFGADDFRAAQGALYSDEVNRINLYHRLQNIFCRDEVLNYHKTASFPAQDLYYPSVGLFLARSRQMALAVKAGCNADNHNHNDTGSLTLFKNGRPLLVDIGVESYTAKTFSDRRYEIWTMQSGYHNLPTLMGLDQKDGAAFCATEVQTSFEENHPSISMELATAYPLDPAAHLSYRRKITLHKDTDQVTVTDVTNCSDAILNLITYEEPVTPAENAESFIQIGDLARLYYQGAQLHAIETLPITDARLRLAWDHDLYRIRLRIIKEECTLTIQ
ncbi:MAG: heparinase II/III-family protein [Candidatus Gastranaerophilales bacterium]|nr:heparinase II/III-family protein [Candidatus Gastranaerophilales bacterium]